MVAIWKQSDSSWIQISRKHIHPILALSLSLVTWHMFPPCHSQYQVVVFLTWTRAKATLGAVLMRLDATLDHYVSNPITLYPPSHPVLPSPTMSPSPYKMHRYPPPTLKSYPPDPPNPLLRRTPGPSPKYLSWPFLLTTSVDL